MRIVKSFEDVQVVLREILDWKSLLSTKDWDFKKLRIKNASPAVDPNDYVILDQLPEQVKKITQTTIPPIAPISGGIVPPPSGGGSGTVTNTGSLVAGRLLIGNGGSDITQGSLTDETNNNVSSTSHGLVPKGPSDATKFLNGAATPAFAQVKDSDLSTSDITTNNVSTSKHGFTPKLPNDATKYLDGTGAYSVPGGGGSGALVFLEHHTASSSSSLDFTTFYSSSYDKYLFIVVGLLAATDGVDLYFRVSTDGGSTYDSGTNYNYVGIRYQDNGTSAGFSGRATNQIKIVGAGGIGNASTDSIDLSMYLYNPGSSALYKQVTYSGSMFIASVNSGSFLFTEGQGGYKSATAVNACRFLLSSGNIASGDIYCYGVSKS